jgi:hypothetical protein
LSWLLTKRSKPNGRGTPGRSRLLTWWFGGLAIGAFAFGLFAERRPFGDSAMAHPLIVFFGLVAAGLIAARIAIRRPVQEVIPDRALVAGLLIAAAVFLVGNFLGVAMTPR